MEEIKLQAQAAIRELLSVSKLQRGDIVVVGCSSSEIAGGDIGKNSSPEIGAAVYAAIAEILAENGLFLAAQCCEHLNRALIIEREAAEKYGLEVVNAVPQPKAGGSFATAAYAAMRSPAAVSELRAAAGLDIGGTLIGMHLRRVAVPVKLKNSAIGEAHVSAARTRPPFVGGVRAVYDEELL
ncbi:MAG: TIGR01440 family protein [Oscillospiraceae bacterium]|jgi:uncharacterized protein (TIGR01440 family)|nr:TIGR01440 family protein [Oscillospiraceae bacterium]